MRRGVLKRVVVFVVVVSLVALVAFGAGVRFDGTQPTFTETEGPQYDTASLQIEPIPSDGSVDTDIDTSGVLLVDEAHANGYDRQDIQPFLSAAVDAGFEVRFAGPGDNTSKRLDNASAYVVINPRESFSRESVDRVEEFVDGGGRLLVVGEPNRLEIQQVGFGSALVPVGTESTTLTSRFGFSLGTSNIYNMERNDGNFQNPVVTPTSRSGLDGVDRVALSTPTTVYANEGTPVLTAAPGSRLSSTRAADEYPVAVKHEGVFVIGDSSFLGGERHTVADNEVLIAELVAYLAEGSPAG